MAIAEIKSVIDSIPANLQAIGMLIPALACGYAKFRDRPRALKPFQDSHFYDQTGTLNEETKKYEGGIGLPTFMQMDFEVHDHAVDGVTPKRDKNKGQMVMILRKAGRMGDKVATILVDDKDVETTRFTEEGKIIDGTNFKHNHKGSETRDAAEY